MASEWKIAERGCRELSIYWNDGTAQQPLEMVRYESECLPGRDSLACIQRITS